MHTTDEKRAVLGRCITVLMVITIRDLEMAEKLTGISTIMVQLPETTPVGGMATIV